MCPKRRREGCLGKYGDRSRPNKYKLKRLTTAKKGQFTIEQNTLVYPAFLIGSESLLPIARKVLTPFDVKRAAGCGEGR